MEQYDYLKLFITHNTNFSYTYRNGGKIFLFSGHWPQCAINTVERNERCVRCHLILSKFTSSSLFMACHILRNENMKIVTSNETILHKAIKGRVKFSLQNRISSKRFIYKTHSIVILQVYQNK